MLLISRTPPKKNHLYFLGAQVVKTQKGKLQHYDSVIDLNYNVAHKHVTLKTTQGEKKKNFKTWMDKVLTYDSLESKWRRANVKVDL